MESMFSSAAFKIAALSIPLHVFNYNFTAQLEYKTRIFTKILGRNAIYFYAVYLVLSALVRDHFINIAIQQDANSLVLMGSDAATVIGWAMFIAGVLLNLWTLKALGIKGMYNGDSFGWIMDAPVTTGPYVYFNDPQYVGTTLALLGYAVQYQSLVGYVLTVCMGVVFWISVKFVEGPHMHRIYSNKKKSKLYNYN